MQLVDLGLRILLHLPDQLVILFLVFELDQFHPITLPHVELAREEKEEEKEEEVGRCTQGNEQKPQEQEGIQVVLRQHTQKKNLQAQE